MTADLLKQYGFNYSGQCRCDGFLTEKYKKYPYEIRWRKGRYKFKVKHLGGTLIDWQPISELEKTLNELAQKNTTSKA